MRPASYYFTLCFWVCCLTAAAQSPVLSRKQVPILCFHQMRNWKPKDKRADKDYIMPPATFIEQMKMLADSGYHTILPEQLYDYLVSGKALPAKPVMLTFDDTNADQFTAARPVLLKYHFKAVFFIITGKIGTHKWFMNAGQIRQLSDEGNSIGCHTTSHRDFRVLKEKDRPIEILESKKQLEKITGKQVDYFAFPYGYWNRAGLPLLHQYGFKAAFQLDAPRDRSDPVMTIRRIVDCGYWSAKTLDNHIRHDFGHYLN